MEQVLSNIIPDLGAGGIIGFILGYATKIIYKIAVALIGVYIGSLVYLQHRGIITINQEALKSTVNSLIPETSALTQNLIAISPFTGGFAAGFYLGFKKM